MGNPNEIPATLSPTQQIVAGLVARARTAQAVAARYTQPQLDELVSAAGWAIMEPTRNRTLAEIAVRDTGLGNTADKIDKNHRKTLDAAEKETLQPAMFPNGHLSPAVTAQPVSTISAVAGTARPQLVNARCLLVEESGAGVSYPFSGEKLCPVLTVYKARDFDHAFNTLRAAAAPHPVDRQIN